MDFDAQTKLADLRIRVLAGEPVTALEYRQIVDDLRRGRESAAAAMVAARKAKPTAAKKQKGPPVDLSTLFGSGGSE